CTRVRGVLLPYFDYW
nr:immunoglobulin heavy chain junction region [Macaca mulatta]MOV91156.1 immunoglobulin heavy chain junction region [Macaca mulatta]